MSGLSWCDRHEQGRTEKGGDVRSEGGRVDGGVPLVPRREQSHRLSCPTYRRLLGGMHVVVQIFGIAEGQKGVTGGGEPRDAGDRCEWKSHRVFRGSKELRGG